jgi:hypothetical protein
MSSATLKDSGGAAENQCNDRFAILCYDVDVTATKHFKYDSLPIAQLT